MWVPGDGGEEAIHKRGVVQRRCVPSEDGRDGGGGSGSILPTMAEEAAVGAWESHHHQLTDEETDETEGTGDGLASERKNKRARSSVREGEC